MNDFLRFLWANKRWWLVPLGLFLALLGVAVFMAGESDVTAYVYPLFEP